MAKGGGCLRGMLRLDCGKVQAGVVACAICLRNGLAEEE